MSAIRGKNTRPELVVRRCLHAAGFRYRLHEKTLPGKPDLVLRKYKAAVFVHGCFWHQHHCPAFKFPVEREDFWRLKIGANVMRDKAVLAELVSQGWRIALVWECMVKGKRAESAIARLARWLQSESDFLEIG